MQGVATEEVLFAEVAELGVGDGTRRAVVIHGVAADAGGVRGFDHDVAAEIGDFRAVIALAEVAHRQRFVEGEFRSFE